MAVTSIQVSTKLLKELKARKLYERETYEEVIEDLLEDTMELSAETKKELAEGRKDIAEGRVYTLDEVKKRLKL